MWPDIRVAFGWVRRLAAALVNEDGLDARGVRRRYGGTIAVLARHRAKLGALAEAFDHLRKVTRSYWAGLFRCYDAADLPRTNNDLEQFFGSYRYHERRCSGRKVASPGLVVRGSVRVVSATATRLAVVTAAELAPADPGAWQMLRAKLAARQETRAMGRRFRRNPGEFLRSLAQKLIKGTVPS